MSLIGTIDGGYYNFSPLSTSIFKANECASFVLRTSDAVSNAILTSHTWKNINLRTLMGNDMYDKYDLFMLKPILAATAANPPQFWGITVDDRITVLNISGLPFVNNTYNASTLTSSSSAIFGTLLTRLAGIATTTNGGSILTFGKYQELVDLTIFYSRFVKNPAGNYQTQGTVGSPFPHFVFSFEIYGIPKEDVEKK
jgi:hypothetical protein